MLSYTNSPANSQRRSKVLKHCKVLGIPKPLAKSCAKFSSPSLSTMSTRATMSFSFDSPDSWSPVVTPEWLAESLKKENGVKVLAAPWYMAVQKRDAKQEFLAERIPGAQFFDVDGIADVKSSAPAPGASPQLPHMLPPAAGFAAAMDALGISNDDHIVVYDHIGIYSAPRVWFTFRAFGHKKVSVLSGGLPAWKAGSFPVDSAPLASAEILTKATAACQAQIAAGAAAPPPRFSAVLDSTRVRSFAQMVENSANATKEAKGGAADVRFEQMMDARSLGRFRGEEPEPRPGLRGGHIPGSRSLAFTEVLESPTPSAPPRFKDPEALRAVFHTAGIDLSPTAPPLIATCGSGMTAAIITLAAHIASDGQKQASLYDGSWMEWGAKQDVPVATGDA